jgi:hypothetical protein
MMIYGCGKDSGRLNNRAEQYWSRKVMEPSDRQSRAERVTDGGCGKHCTVTNSPPCRQPMQDADKA